MTDTEVNTAVGSFIDRIKEIVKGRKAARSEQETRATVKGRPMPPKSPRKPRRKPDGGTEAVKRFTHGIESALQGDQAAKEITEAVWLLLRDLGIEYHGK